MPSFLIQAPRWLLLATLLTAPWAFGSTRPWTINLLLIQLTTVLALWVAGCATRRQWPVIHRVPFVLALLLILEAWGMVLNAKSEYENLQFVDLHRIVSWAAGSVNRAASIEIALRITVLLLTGLYVCDLVRRPVWRKRLLLTMAMAGVSIAVLGIAQRVTQAPGIFWGEPVPGGTFFATYRYHANAGAYLNLAWPIVAALFVIASHRSTPRRGLWGLALVICLTAMFVNSSRASLIVAIILALVWLVWLYRQYKTGKLRIAVNPAGIVAVALGIVLLLTMAYTFGGLDLSRQRWEEFTGELSFSNPRWLVSHACWNMLPEAGAFGFGPGTFLTIFPYFTRDWGNTIQGIWEFAHQDYLQTVIEWGWLGAAAWGLLIFGGILYAWNVKRRDAAQWSTSERVYYFAILTAFLGVLLHALVDFPLQIASTQLYVAVFAGMLWGSANWRELENQNADTGTPFSPSDGEKVAEGRMRGS
jgi:O-antigen ligase